MFSMNLDDAATIAAALAHYIATNQGEPDQRTDEVHDLATFDERIISLNNEAVTELFNRVKSEATRLATPRDDFTVHWVIQVAADDVYQAAAKALEIHRDPASLATCFTVEADNGDIHIDLLPEG